MSAATMSLEMRKYGSERSGRCLPKPARHLFFFRLLWYSNNEEVKYITLGPILKTDLM